MTSPESKAVGRSWLVNAIVPVCSLAMLALMVGLVLASAGDTLGYDYSCYAGAARHLLDGKSIYDNAFSISVGTCPGTYTYPPAFAVALVPWLAFGGAAAGLWCLAMALCFVAGVALLPVRRDIRWLVVIVAALDWPLLYAIKLGQVEPLLFLGFAVAWRWMDRPWVVGVVTAMGALIKVQPGVARGMGTGHSAVSGGSGGGRRGGGPGRGGDGLYGAGGLGHVRGPASGFGRYFLQGPQLCSGSGCAHGWRAGLGGVSGAVGVR
ncbi:MAG TPA: glycosyltransferase family 87 protein, partial [Candidatus Limnocylindrales bacterium]